MDRSQESFWSQRPVAVFCLKAALEGAFTAHPALATHTPSSTRSIFPAAARSSSYAAGRAREVGTFPACPQELSDTRAEETTQPRASCRVQRHGATGCVWAASSSVQRRSSPGAALHLGLALCPELPSLCRTRNHRVYQTQPPPFLPASAACPPRARCAPAPGRADEPKRTQGEDEHEQRTPGSDTGCSWRAPCPREAAARYSAAAPSRPSAAASAEDAALGGRGCPARVPLQPGPQRAAGPTFTARGLRPSRYLARDSQAPSCAWCRQASPGPPVLPAAISPPSTAPRRGSSSCSPREQPIRQRQNSDWLPARRKSSR